MINVGIIGLGMMGQTHLDVYAKRDDVKIIAVADRDEDLRTGKTAAAGNVEGQAQGGFDFSTVKQYAEADDLINDPDIDLVDICLPTTMHDGFTIKALEAGKHVIVEKPLARTAERADALAAAAAKAKGIAFCAQCMRFWPAWEWLKDSVDSGKYGKVLSATFRRVANFPGGAFYKDGKQSGGAVLDLHIHDADFIQYLFGMPTAVTSQGYSRDTGATDHIVTQYHYADVPIVVAEGGWTMTPGFGFKMQYTVNFENATAIFEIGGKPELRIVTPDGETDMDLGSQMGYEREIDYLLTCIKEGRAPQRVTLASAADSVRLIEAEVRSVESGKTVTL